MSKKMTKRQQEQYNRIQSILKISLKETKTQIKREVIKKYKSIISEFYNGYNPVYYKRWGNPSNETGGLYNLLKINTSGNRIYIESSYANFASRETYKIDTESLFNLTMEHGIHGRIEIEDAINGSNLIMKPSPETLFQNYLDSYDATSVLLKHFYENYKKPNS